MRRHPIRAWLVWALAWPLVGAGAELPRVAGPGADASRQVVVTVVNSGFDGVARAGSTPKGYAGAAGYSASAQAGRRLARIETRHRLRRLAEWPIAALGVHCAVFEIPAEAKRDDLLALLRSDPEVESAQPMQTFATRTGTAYDDPYVGLQPGLQAMDIAGAHGRSRGERVKVAVVDTGADVHHPELAGRIADSVNLVEDDGSASPPEVHGTAVAGVIGATANNGVGIVGIAPEARLLLLRGCWQASAAGDAGATCNSFTLARALAHAITERASVINLSLTGPPDPLLERLLRRAIERGAIVVGARDEGPGPADAFPASVSDVIVVRSAQPADAAPGICAPGRDVLTLRPRGGYDFENGSSLAAAQMSGVVALLRARDARLDARGMRALLERHRVTDGHVRCMVNACAALATLVDGVSCRSTPSVAASFASPQK